MIKDTTRIFIRQIGALAKDSDTDLKDPVAATAWFFANRINEQLMEVSTRDRCKEITYGIGPLRTEDDIQEYLNGEVTDAEELLKLYEEAEKFYPPK